MEALGVSWVVLGTLFFMLVFGMVFKSALGAVWPGFLFDFNGFWEGFGRGLGLLSASWGTFERHFLVLVFGMVFKSALGGFWARHWVDFRGVGTNFGRVWGRFWEGLGGIFEHSG